MSDVKIEHKVAVSRDEAAAWLSVLSKAFAADGHVELTLGPSEVKIHVPDRLQAELEVEVEGDDVEIELEFTWSRAQLAAAVAATTAQRPAAKPRRPQHASGARTPARPARKLADALGLSVAIDSQPAHADRTNGSAHDPYSDLRAIDFPTQLLLAR
jgi:amphi-Trp domain-containing protein